MNLSTILIVCGNEVDPSHKTAGKVRYIGGIAVDAIRYGTGKRKPPSQETVLKVGALRDWRANGLETCQDYMLIRIKGDRVGARRQCDDIQAAFALATPKRKTCSYTKARGDVDQERWP